MMEEQSQRGRSTLSNKVESLANVRRRDVLQLGRSLYPVAAAYAVSLQKGGKFKCKTNMTILHRSQSIFQLPYVLSVGRTQVGSLANLIFRATFVRK